MWDHLYDAFSGFATCFFVRIKLNYSSKKGGEQELHFNANTFLQSGFGCSSKIVGKIKEGENQQ